MNSFIQSKRSKVTGCNCIKWQIRTTETSPQVYARIGGLAYLIIVVAGAMDEIFIRSKLIVADNAVATTKNISASPLPSLHFGMIQTAILLANKLNLMTPLFLLADARYLKAFDPQ